MKKILLLSVLILAACAVFAEDNQLMKFADALYDSGDYYRSISEYKRYIFYNEKGKHVKNARYKIAMSYLLAGKYEEAADTFDKVSLDYDGDLKYMSLLGEAAAFTYKKDYVYSSAVVSRILNDENSGKYSDQAHYMAGFNNLYTGEYKSAASQFGSVTGPELRDSSASISALLNKSGDIPSRSPILSGLFSAVIPGSGHMYCGRWSDGLISLVLNSFFIYNGYNAFRGTDSVQKLIYGITGTIIYGSSIYGAVVAANKFNDDEVAKFVKSAEEYRVDVIKTEF